MTKLRTLAIAAAALAVPLTALAADHLDISGAAMEPTADLTDLYAWMDDASEMLNLVMAVNANAGDDAQFSDALAYVFHVDSMAAYGEGQTGTNIICKFTAAAMIECWTPTDYAVGDPSATDGLMSMNETFRVFAGLRNDPFFLEYDGFLATEQAAYDAVVADAVTFDDDGCVLLSQEQSTALVTQLKTAPGGVDAPSNYFADHNVLALVVQIAKTEVNSGGPILGIWAETKQVQ